MSPPNPDDLVIDAPSGRVVIPASELRWTAARAAGPGGQNVNKLSTKIDLRFDVGASAALGAAVKERLCALPGARLDASGCVIVVAQSARTQAGNLAAARTKLAALVRAALVPPKRRRKTRPTAASKRRRLTAKREQSDKKAARGRVRDA